MTDAMLGLRPSARYDYLTRRGDRHSSSNERGRELHELGFVDTAEMEQCPRGTSYNETEEFCVLCPAGTLCPYSNDDSDRVCPPSHYCPPGSWNLAELYCYDGAWTTNNTDGITEFGDCEAPNWCWSGFYCPLGAIESDHRQLLFPSTYSVEKTIVFPNNDEAAVTISSVFNVADDLNIWGIRWSDNRADFPNWLEMAPNSQGCPDMETNGCYMDPQMPGMDQIDLQFVLRSDVGIPLSTELTFTYILKFRTSDNYAHEHVPIYVEFSFQSTTVIFEPNEVEASLRVTDDPTELVVSMFNIGCDDDVSFNASLIDCRQQFGSDEEAYVDWLDLAFESTTGFLSKDAADPALIRFDTKVRSSSGVDFEGQIYDYLTDGSSEYFEEEDDYYYVSNGRAEEQRVHACVRIEFALSSQANKTLVTDIPVNILLYEDCEAGTFSLTGNSQDAQCTNCGLGTYQDLTGQQSCKPCPESFPKTAREGSTALSDCIAKPGEFRDTDPDSLTFGTSLACLEGATCVGEGLELETIPLNPGHWRAYNGSKRIWKCPTESFCTGGAASFEASTWGYCLEFHVGPLCQDCIPGYVRRGTQTQCAICSPEAIDADRVRLGWTIAAGASLVLVAFLVVQYARMAKSAKKAADAVRRGRQSVIERFRGGSLTTKAQPLKKERPKTFSKRFASSLRAKKSPTLLWKAVVSIESNVKIRVLVGLFQILSGISANFLDHMPPAFHETVRPTDLSPSPSRSLTRSFSGSHLRHLQRELLLRP